MKRFLKVSGVIVLSLIGLLLLLWVLFLWSFRGTTSEFEDCFPPVTLVSTKETPNIYFFRRFGYGDSFRLGRGDYGLCTSQGTICNDVWGNYRDFTILPIGTEIMLDGFVTENNIPYVAFDTYFRGEIDSKIVWLDFMNIQSLADPVNENSFKLLGMKDELGQDISESSWKCTQ